MLERMGAGWLGEAGQQGAEEGCYLFPEDPLLRHVSRLGLLEQIGVGNVPERTHSWQWAGWPPAPLRRAFRTSECLCPHTSLAVPCVQEVP